MAYDGTIPALGNLISNDIPAMQENFSLLESAQVVDEGTTADGDYIRYENGWQICFFQDNTLITTDNTQSGIGVWRSTELTYTFPQSFTSSPIVAPTENDTIFTWSGVNLISLTNVKLLLYGTANTTIGYLGYIAIGRWK